MFRILVRGLNDRKDISIRLKVITKSDDTKSFYQLIIIITISEKIRKR